ncbi:uncharacterized protein SAMN05421736_101465 [Evansella caseinilytica]|uniref:TPM domain-containing protein n=1 Tax=Evansella caseinilytica TaxID=1503961 RepID=A0A1H3HDQ0_9BACI|nr:TPM domain-containing protein [Evansella caseinilytica]SDY13591.1 uncharacterized protein SAMN05421736_101465 [Evansella caseinilytica]
MVKNRLFFKQQLFLTKTAMAFMLVLFVFLPLTGAFAASESRQLIFDNAGLLTEQQQADLQALAVEYGEKRETDYIFLTVDDPEAGDVTRYMEDFYDAYADENTGYENAVLLVLDMYERDVQLASFGEAKTSLEDDRLTMIREQITPDLSSGNYEEAFRHFVKTADKYMGIRPGINPESVIFKLWFQLAVSAGIGGIVVGIMLYNSGGKVTVNSNTYMDPSNSNVVQRRDRFIRETVTKRKKPSNNNNSRGGGFGGGGVTRGGRSYSGSRGKF